MKTTTSTLLLILGIVLVANLISEQYFFRIDFTEDKQYTLSNATQEILKGLEEPVTVKAYFSDELPPQFSKSKKDLEEFLIEYSRLSNNNIVYDFINPNEDEKTESEAIKAGVQPVMINVREKDQMKQQKAFLGAVMELGEQREVIPFIKPGAPLEYILSTAIKKMSITEKPAIGFVQGHGEPGLDELAQVNADLNVLYRVEPYRITDTLPVPERFNTLIVVRPVDSIPEGQLKQLDEFLQRGGNLFIAMNRVDGDLQSASGKAVNTGLEKWLQDKGLTVEDNFLVDADCGALTVQQQQGSFRFSSNVNFPFIPIISNFADHPVTKGIESVIMQFVSPLRFTGDTTVKFIPLAFSSELSGSLKAPQFFNIQKQWTKADFPLQRQVVAAVLEKQAENDQQWRMLVVGDGDFPVGGKQSRQLQTDNVNLMVNAIDWLSDKTGLIELRTKGIQYRPIDELEDSTKTLLKWCNFLLPIVLLLIYGLLRYQMNRNLRYRRMQENYE